MAGGWLRVRLIRWLFIAVLTMPMSNVRCDDSMFSAGAGANGLASMDGSSGDASQQGSLDQVDGDADQSASFPSSDQDQPTLPQQAYGQMYSSLSDQGQSNQDQQVNQQASSVMSQTQSDQDSQDDQQASPLSSAMDPQNQFGSQSQPAQAYQQVPASWRNVGQPDQPNQVPMSGSAPSRALNQIYQQATPRMFGMGQNGQSRQAGQANQQAPAQPYGVGQQQQQQQQQQFGQINNQRSTSSFYPSAQPWSLGQNNQAGSGSSYRPRQPTQADQSQLSNPSYGSYMGSNGRGSSSASGFNNQKPNNGAPLGQKPWSALSNNKPNGQNFKKRNRSDHNTPPLVMRYTNEEMPCALYPIRSGSRQIVSNTADDDTVTWLLKVPSKPSYNAIPKFLTVQNASVGQLTVNYLNANQSPTLLPDNTELEIMADAEDNDISAFPESIPAQMLEVIIDGLPSPVPPPGLQVQMIICYKPISAMQSQQSGNQQQSAGNQNQQAGYQNQQSGNQNQQSGNQNQQPGNQNQQSGNQNQNSGNQNQQPGNQNQQSGNQNQNSGNQNQQPGNQNQQSGSQQSGYQKQQPGSQQLGGQNQQPGYQFQQLGYLNQQPQRSNSQYQQIWQPTPRPLRPSVLQYPPSLSNSNAQPTATVSIITQTPVVRQAATPSVVYQYSSSLQPQQKRGRRQQPDSDLDMDTSESSE